MGGKPRHAYSYLVGARGAPRKCSVLVQEDEMNK